MKKEPKQKKKNKYGKVKRGQKCSSLTSSSFQCFPSTVFRTDAIEDRITDDVKHSVMSCHSLMINDQERRERKEIE